MAKKKENESLDCDKPAPDDYCDDCDDDYYDLLRDDDFEDWED